MVAWGLESGQEIVKRQEGTFWDDGNILIVVVVTWLYTIRQSSSTCILKMVQFYCTSVKLLERKNHIGRECLSAFIYICFQTFQMGFLRLIQFVLNRLHLGGESLLKWTKLWGDGATMLVFSEGFSVEGTFEQTQRKWIQLSQKRSLHMCPAHFLQNLYLGVL